MKKNGKVLGEKLKEMYEFLGRKVMIMGDSKGGVDREGGVVY
ncbi:hypothetical protein [Bacillus altitudinis]|nr:hypothetical protein [Bacillus altitudinis]